MIKEYQSIKAKIGTATTDVILDDGLTNIELDGTSPRQDSDRYDVGLVDKTDPNNWKYYSFAIDPVEVLLAMDGGPITIEALKPFVRREIEKLVN